MNDEELIDAISRIRAANNKNWMAILKLAVEARPAEAKAILQDIRDCDRRIGNLTQALATSRENR